MTAYTIEPSIRMSDLMAAYPGARRALFKKFHIGGCRQCGYHDDDTLADVAAQHGKDVETIVTFLRTAQEQETTRLIEPAPALQEVQRNGARLIDLRSPEEFAAHHPEGAEPISEQFAEEIMQWPKDSRIILYCGDGQGSWNAAAYMADYGFTRVACVKGGYVALREVDQA